LTGITFVMNVAITEERCNVVFSHGKELKIYIDGIRGDRFLNSLDPAATVDSAETTPFASSGRKSFIPGNIDATLSAGGLWEGSSSESDQFLNSLVTATSQTVINWFPNKDTLGNFGYGITADLTGYGQNMPVDGVVNLTADFQASKGRDRVESLRALTTTAAAVAGSTVAGTADDNAAATTKGSVGFFQRTDNTTASIAAKVQHSANNSTWDTLLSFTTITARGGERVVASTGTVKRYTRSHLIITGTTAKVTSTFVGLTRR